MQVTGTPPTITLGGGNGSITAGLLAGPGEVAGQGLLGAFDQLFGMALGAATDSSVASKPSAVAEQPGLIKLVKTSKIGSASQAVPEIPSTEPVTDGTEGIEPQSESPVQPIAVDHPAVAIESEVGGIETASAPQNDDVETLSEAGAQNAADLLPLPKTPVPVVPSAQTQTAAPEMAAVAVKPAPKIKTPAMPATIPAEPQEQPTQAWNIKDLALGIDGAIDQLQADGAVVQEPKAKASKQAHAQGGLSALTDNEASGNADELIAQKFQATLHSDTKNIQAEQSLDLEPSKQATAPDSKPDFASGPKPVQDSQDSLFQSGQITQTEWDAALLNARGAHKIEGPAFSEQLREATRFLAEQTEGVIRMGDKGVEAQLKLSPPELGGVRVNLSVGSDLSVRTEFIAERGDTVQLIQNNVDHFRQVMSQHGLVVDRVQVSVAAGGGSSTSNSESGYSSQQQDPRQEGRAAGERRGNEQSRNNPQRAKHEEQE